MAVVADTVVLIIKYERILLMVLLIIMKKSFLVKKKDVPNSRLKFKTIPCLLPKLSKSSPYFWQKWLEAIPFGAAHTYYSSCKGVLPGYVDK